MARRSLADDGSIRWIELTREELIHVLRIDQDLLTACSDLLPPPRDDRYRFDSAREWQQALDRFAILRTRLSREALARIEDAGMLAAYGQLARECPRQVNVHVYRSYVAVVLFQMQGRMLDATALAEVASLDGEDADGNPIPGEVAARKHLQLLQAVGMLTPGEGRWEFTHVPRSLQQGE